jgi:anti-sigma factor RsiW
MQRPSDELLVAYLDGELDAGPSAEVAAAIARDPALSRDAQALRESAAALRAAFDEVLHEPVPERLLAAARGQIAHDKIVRFPEPRERGAKQATAGWRQWASLPIAASLASLIVGGGFGYLVATQSLLGPGTPTANVPVAANWIDNVAGYHTMFVNAGPNDRGLVDIPADPQSDSVRKLPLPTDFRLPDLKPWGLAYQGARVLFIEGRPATQLFYTTDNKALGAVTVVVASTSQPDVAPTPDSRGDLHMLYWRHRGHLYGIVGTANTGYLWNIHNDLAWQLDGI